jgi:hypothetical protein
MALAIVLMGISSVSSVGDRFEQWHPTFWLETAAVEAFGFSWLVKGEADKILFGIRRNSVAPRGTAATQG